MASNLSIHTHKFPGSKLNQRIFKKAAKWIAQKLVGDRMQIALNIYFRKLDGYTGFCEWMEEPFNPRQFRIIVASNQNYREQLRTLSHELVHLKQYATNELYDYQTAGNKTRWRGRILDSEKTPYRKQPWEKEAYSRQTPLLFEFLKDNKIKLKKKRQ